MTSKEALNIFRQVAEKFVADGQTHQVIQQAIGVLSDAIEPPKPQMKQEPKA